MTLGDKGGEQLSFVGDWDWGMVNVWGRLRQEDCCKLKASMGYIVR